MRIIAYKTSLQNGKVLIEESGGESAQDKNLDHLFAFLLEPYEDGIKVCWDLDATVSLILRLMGEKACHDLQKRKRAYMPPFNIWYYPGKVFILRHIPTGQKCNLYGLEQYYPELPDPGAVDEVQMLGVKLMRELEKMGMVPTKLTSPIAIYDQCVMSKLDLPKLKDIPGKCAEYAYRTAGRLWIEAHKLGWFGEVYDYDLSSAFPEVAKELIDVRDLRWVKSPDYKPGAIYGYVRCVVTIYDWVMVSPIIRETEEALISPTSTWEEFLTKGELDFITKHGIGEYKILEGYWAYLKIKKELRRPLEEPLEKLLAYKQGTELQRLLAKRMATGIYGKSLEDWEDLFGTYFNPVWGSEISTQARLQVAETLYAHGIGPGDNEGYRSLIQIGVDGFMMDEPVEIEDGQWKMAYQGEALVIGSGLVYTQLTKPKGLKLNDVLAMIEEHPRRNIYQKNIERRLTLGDSLSRNRLNEIGNKMLFSTSINLLTQEHDREFKKVPQTGQQLLNKHYKSEPIKV